MLVVPAGSVLMGRSAAWMHGGRWVCGSLDPVEMAVPPSAPGRTRERLAVRRVSLVRSEIANLRGLPVTTPLRTAWDVAAAHPVETSVPVLDELLHRGIVERTQLRAFADGRRGHPGAARARAAIESADGRAESPPESRLRLLLERAGLTPVPQVRIRDRAGRVVARTDLGFPEERVGVEYDGAHHAEPGQFTRDRVRLNAIQEAGWRIVFVTAADLRNLDGAVRRVREALAQARQGRK